MAIPITSVSAVYQGSDFQQCLFASYLIRLRPYADALLPKFLHEMLESEKVKKEIRKQVKSSAGNYNLNTQGIRGLQIPIPSTKLQIDLLNDLTAVDEIVNGTKRHLISLIELRSTILNNFFTG